jgi:tellurite resistance protein TerC
VVIVWLAFLLFIGILLALDLGVFHRKAHVVSVREALGWTAIWLTAALLFSVFVYFGYQHNWLGMGLTPDVLNRAPGFPDGRPNDAWSAFLKFLTGYVVELSLSADNVFVIAMLFGYFHVPRQYQHRVLFWGILGALVMRGVMIAVGAALVSKFSWILILFGIILVITAIRMLFMGEGHSDPSNNFILRFMRRHFPLTTEFRGEHFFVREPAVAPASSAAGRTGSSSRGKLMMTPLAPALVMVETTDLVFAVDSIPAIFAITADPFLIFTSNVFAILGLRSLYFALAGLLHTFRYLKHALAVVLLTVGVKMLAHHQIQELLGPHFNLYLLATVILILASGIGASLIDQRWRRA